VRWLVFRRLNTGRVFLPPVAELLRQRQAEPHKGMSLIRSRHREAPLLEHPPSDMMDGVIGPAYSGTPFRLARATGPFIRHLEKVAWIHEASGIRAMIEIPRPRAAAVNLVAPAVLGGTVVGNVGLGYEDLEDNVGLIADFRVGLQIHLQAAGRQKELPRRLQQRIQTGLHLVSGCKSQQVGRPLPGG